jgi:alkylhydroperoxidase/carboxymuconolactone decarboxylase family protein YurZ
MSETATRLRKAVLERVLEGAGTTTSDRRRAAFDNSGVDEPMRALVDKVSNTAWKVTDDDVAAAKGAGVAEDAIFELTVTAALGQSSRQLASALAAVEQAFAKEKP